MSKVKCEVVRDLMPLVIDDVASEGSKRLVQAHMEDCEGCRGYYTGMTAAISRAAMPPESDKSFIKLGKRMKRKVGLRKILIVVLIFAVLTVGSMAAYDYATTWVDMPIDYCDVQLAYDDDGDVIMHVENSGGPGWFHNWGYEEHDGVYYIIPHMPRMTLTSGVSDAYEELYDLAMVDNRIYVVFYDYEDVIDQDTGEWESERREIRIPIRYIRWGTPYNYDTLYVSGDVLPTMDELLNGETGGVREVIMASPAPEATGRPDQADAAQPTPEATDAPEAVTATPVPQG